MCTGHGDDGSSCQLPGSALVASAIAGSVPTIELVPDNGLAASPLSGTNSIVGTEPAMADATRALPGNWHDEPSSPCPVHILSCKLDYRSGGSLLESRPGSILESAE